MSEKSHKTCWVCGDRCAGKNFGVFSCESCKAFFRRNAFKDFECRWSDACDVNMVTRKACRKCRLRKCFAIGMKKEWILNESEKEIRKKIINENRLKRMNEKNCAKSGDNSIESFESNTYSSISSSNDTIDTEELMDLFGDNSSTQELTLSPENAMPVTILRPITNSITLNEAEGMRLSEVLAAADGLHRSMVANGIDHHIITFPNMIRYISEFFESEAKYLVKMCKSLRSFSQLCESDRISLLKIGVLDMCLMRTVLLYDPSTNCWIVPQGNACMHINVDLWKHAKRNCHQDHVKLNSGILPLWDKDPVVIHLLTTIILFNSNRPNLIHKDLIKWEQKVYIELLRRYLQMKYWSESAAATRLMALIDNFKTIQLLSTKHAFNFHDDCKCCTRFSAPDVPLLQEICDITHYKDPIDCV